MNETIYTNILHLMTNITIEISSCKIDLYCSNFFVNKRFCSSVRIPHY